MEFDTRYNLGKPSKLVWKKLFCGFTAIYLSATGCNIFCFPTQIIFGNLPKMKDDPK